MASIRDRFARRGSVRRGPEIHPESTILAVLTQFFLKICFEIYFHYAVSNVFQIYFYWEKTYFLKNSMQIFKQNPEDPTLHTKLSKNWTPFTITLYCVLYSKFPLAVGSMNHRAIAGPAKYDTFVPF
jgi:hypothetical protein